MSVEAGGQAVSETGNIAAMMSTWGPSTGTVMVSGAGSNWTTSDSLNVGGGIAASGGNGTLNVSGGGSVQVGTTLRVWNAGEVNLGGSGRITAPSLEIVGGTLVRTGGQLALADVPVPVEPFFDIGRNGGTGTLHISAGGKLISGGEHVYVGFDTGSMGVTTVTGAGDATLDGSVTISDLSILAANWQGPGKHWFEGDYNYDGLVNVSDLSILAGNWQKGVSGGSSMSFAEALAMFDPFDELRASMFHGVVVPEPHGAVLIGLAGLLVLRHRRAGGDRKVAFFSGKLPVFR